MIIKDNINAIRIFNRLNSQVNQSNHIKEKLSTGYQINRAADNAAGLTISEGMRAQIRGLSMASENTQNGLSLIQTADGALSEVHSILQRIRVLAVQSANDTYTKKDKEIIQDEADELKLEIDRIAKTTEFNKRVLLDGTYEYKEETSSTKASYETEIDFASVRNGSTLTIEGVLFEFDTDNQVNHKDAIQVSINKDDTAQTKADALKTAFDNTSLGNLFITTMNAIDASKVKFVIEANEEVNKQKIQVSYNDFEIPESNYKITKDEIFYEITNLDESMFIDGFTLTVGSHIFELDTDEQLNNSGAQKINIKGLNIRQIKSAIENIVSPAISADDLDFAMTGEKQNCSITFVDWNMTGNFPSIQINDSKTLPSAIKNSNTISKMGQTSEEAIPLILQVGANTDELLKVFLDGVSTNHLGIDEISLQEAQSASLAIDTIDKAIETVSAGRSNLGSMQNRLEHIYKNLKVGEENLTATESRIRDTNLAKEMVQFSKGSIVEQAAQAMLVQANNVPNALLRLLQ